MIYEIYGQSRKTMYEFRKFDALRDGLFAFMYWRKDNDVMRVRAHSEYETILLDTEETDWVYTEDDHITYKGEEYKVEKVSKTLHEDHAKVYIGYVKDLGDDEESKKQAESEAELYESGKKDALESAIGEVHFREYDPPKRKRWFIPWRD